MTNTILSGGAVYQVTTVRIPQDIKQKAKDMGINMSKTLVEALNEKINKLEIFE